MGLMDPAPPPFEVEKWKGLSHLERIKPLAQDWAINGFGTPPLVYLLYIAKIAVYALGGLLIISLTPGLGGLGNLGSWWTEPIVFEKAVVWTMLWEILGLGAGSLPLTLRFKPMIGGVLYWSRPGTTRLPPWPKRIPLTRGSTRTPIDVALYAGVLFWLGYLLFAGGVDRETTVFAGRLDPGAVATLLILLGLLGLRDKVPFLAARAEIYGSLMLIFFFPLTNLIIAAQLVFVCIWWGAASSKLNKHFPFVVTVMISNTPWNRSRSLKKRLYRKHPEDLRPSDLGAFVAHMGTVMEFTLPAILLVSAGGTIGWIAAIGMIVFHLHILSTFPLAVPLEWNVFMIFGILFLFGHYGSVPFSTLESTGLVLILALICAGIPIVGNFRPDLISFLPSMRYYAGNWATSQWLFRREGGAEARLDERIVKAAPIVPRQLEHFYDREMIEVLLYKGLAFRSMHSHGRALNGLLGRAVDDVDEYDVREGELVAGVVLGYNFGDGHFHNLQLLEAVQERCAYESGELRVVALESQPAGQSQQRYRIYDAADGLVEEGTVEVADMVSRQPWLDGKPFPARPDGGARSEKPAAAG
jgi:Transmembrane protein of unknown function (DUF3556)